MFSVTVRYISQTKGHECFNDSFQTSRLKWNIKMFNKGDCGKVQLEKNVILVGLFLAAIGR